MSRCVVAFEDGSVCGILASTTNERGLLVCIDHAPKCHVCQRPLLTLLSDGMHQSCVIADGFKAMTETRYQKRYKNIYVRASESAENGANNNH